MAWRRSRGRLRRDLRSWYKRRSGEINKWGYKGKGVQRKGRKTAVEECLKALKGDLEN